MKFNVEVRATTIVRDIEAESEEDAVYEAIANYMQYDTDSLDVDIIDSWEDTDENC